MYKKKVCICVWEADIKTHWGRERPVLSLSVHANEKAVLWEWKVPKTADLLKQYTLYWCILQEPVYCHKHVYFRTAHSSSVWSMDCIAGCFWGEKMVHNCRKLFTSARRETYIVVNQDKWTRDGDIERKTNGVVHRWKSKGEKNTPFVILNAAEQFHLPSCLQSIILSPARMNTQSIFFISIFRVFKVIPASIFKVFKILDQYSFCTRRAFCFTLIQ